MRVGDSICLGLTSSVGAEVDIADVITFGIEDESNMDYSGGYFDGLNYVKHVDWFLDE